MVQKKSKPQSKPPQRPQEEPPARRRGRPRQYDPERALANAAQAFWKYGYAATSLDDLVAATGMNRPSLYAAFGDKRDLYLKTLDRYQQRSRAIGQQIIADNPRLRVFLRRFYDAALDIYLAGGDEARGCYSISTAPAQATTDAKPCVNFSPPVSAVRMHFSPGKSPRRTNGARSHRTPIPGRWPRSRPLRCIRSPCAPASACRENNSPRWPQQPSI